MGASSILLVNLYYQESGYGERLNFPPVGIGYLSEYLDAEGIHHQVLDTGAGYSHEQVIQAIQDMQPDIVGFSLNSVCFPKSSALIRRVREIFPNIRIVTGGPHVSTVKTELLLGNPAIDYAVIGEGEMPLANLCRGITENIPGIIYRSPKSGIVQNAPVYQMDIDRFPFPRYSHFNLKKRYHANAISLLTSRGCPFKCIFCQQSSLLGKQWRGRSPENIVEEVQYWYSQGITSFHVLDDNFTLQKERVSRLAALLEQRGMESLDFSLIGGVRVQGTDEDLLTSLKRIGVRYLSLGIESGADKILKFANKGFTEKDADRAIRLATQMGFRVRLFFIIGFPYETMEDVQKSFDLALRYPIYDVRFFNLIPYEEAPLMNWLKKNGGKLLYPYDEYMSDFKRFQRIPVFDSPYGMSVEEKRKALEHADDIVRQVEQRQTAFS